MTAVDTTAPTEEATVALPHPAKVISVGRPTRDDRTGCWTITAAAWLGTRPRISQLHLVTIDRGSEDEARAEIPNLVDVLRVIAPWGADDDVEVHLP